MRYVDEFRDAVVCRKLVERIRATVTRTRTIMEVCGGQTHGLLRYGIDQELEGAVRLVHGPGCPVCVTPLEQIDLAIDLARRPGMVLASFGDMLRVPGSRESLLQARAGGAQVQIVYSPLDAVRLARRLPEQQVVFFAVGFETTAPTTALAVRQAERWGLENFTLLVAHVRVLPAMEMLAARPDNGIEAFLAAGHVCTVAGYECYRPFVERFGLPVVVTGFEPVDLLAGIFECVRQLEAGEARLCNRYTRSARSQGNRRATELVQDVYEICDRPWRGIGIVPAGGLRLRPAYARFDAEARFDRGTAMRVAEPSDCRAGEVLTGRIAPSQCECFGTRCTPESPMGAPMVSSEGACAAYYRYARPTTTD
ncbi:MAG: hydrogenase formation protein HypD [Planctomycetota bacterium]|nr:MAG: hydrogenase formation protein HypD [Planctomycetota bacterium]